MTDAHVVALVAKNKAALLFAIVTLEAAALIVDPVGGYTVMVCPEAFQMPTIAPTSVGGNFTPVEADEVVMALKTADNCSASVALEPVATNAVAPSPQMDKAERGELPAPKTREGIAICAAPFK